MPAGQLSLGLGLTDQQLWFVRTGNDLTMDVLGSQDQVTVQSWYGSNQSAQLSAILTTDGMKLDSGLAQFVSAVATYAANNPGFNPATIGAMPNAATLQNTIAAVWHH